MFHTVQNNVFDVFIFHKKMFLMSLGRVDMLY